jgi:hypothetical protein
MMPPVDDTFSEQEKERHAYWTAYGKEGRGYLQIQGTKPQTLGYGLHDSPVAQLAWIAEKYQAWTKVPLTDDEILTNVSIYWFTGSGGSAAQFMYESQHSREWPQPSGVPQGWAVFSAEALTRRAFNPAGLVEHFSEFEQGGHFPALEVPDLLLGDLRLFFRQYR